MSSRSRPLPSLYRKILAAFAAVVGVVALTDGLLWGRPFQQQASNVLLGSLAALLIGLWLARRIAGPLNRLTQAAEAYAGGTRRTGAPDASIREIRALSDAMDRMARQLRMRLEELTAERNQVTAILQAMTEGVVAVDEQGRVLIVNPAA